MPDQAEITDLRVVVNLEDGRYIAQGVDYDIVAFGDCLDAALDAFGHAFIRQCLVARHFGDDPLSHLPPSRAEFVSQWDACTRDANHQVRHFDIPAFTVQPADTKAQTDGPRRGTALIAA